MVWICSLLLLLLLLLHHVDTGTILRLQGGGNDRIRVLDESIFSQ